MKIKRYLPDSWLTQFRRPAVKASVRRFALDSIGLLPTLGAGSRLMMMRPDFKKPDAPVTAVAHVSSMAWGEIAGSVVAAAFGLIVSRWHSRRPRAIPTFVLMGPVVFALSPGSHGLRLLETWISGQQITGVNDSKSLAWILLAIGIGLLIGQTVSGRGRWLGNWSKELRGKWRID